ncbi:hypothetical protein LTR97_003751 [Elasticomyces elasticus]|uniref:F-box domain-containing protein n=1 Tax=Elasticomyces elasticus TaxID=574655 RepID=A0AAN7WEG3_9PEZI|nr:hypothetical protein LTR97_003751 [Elasticomyces elasticus]
MDGMADPRLDVPIADPNNTPCLMSLPPEIRELIWSFAFVKPHPIIAQVDHQTVTSDKCRAHTERWFQDSGLTTHRQTKAVPELPSVVLVNKSLSKEVLPLFFRNTFMFRLERRNVGDVQFWLEEMYCHLVAITGESASRKYINKNITVRIEFAFGEYRAATIEYRICSCEGHMGFHFRLGGQLEQECICWLGDAITIVVEQNRDGGILEEFSEMAEQIEKRVEEIVYISPKLDVDMTDHRDTPCLMGLPPELREMIWTFAVLEPYPIIAYVKWQTVPSSQRIEWQWYKERGITTARQMKTVPELPPLAFVAKSVAREVIPIFLSNTFLFSIDQHNAGEVGDWVYNVYDKLAVCTGDEEESCTNMNSNITIRIEFGVPRSRIATIEYTMRSADGHERFRLKIDGHLTEECRCWLADARKTIDEESVVLRDDVEYHDGRWGMGELTGIIERRIRHVWSIRERNCASATCSTCGKTQYASVKDQGRAWYMWRRTAVNGV